jgi:hypothetical protein
MLTRISRSTCRSRLLAPLASALAALLLLLSTPTLAAEVNWIGPNGGSWASISNWYPFQLPAAGDVVWVKAQTTSPVSVIYSSPAGPAFSKVHIDSPTNTHATHLIQAQDHLQSGEMNVGVFKLGAHSNSGGTNVVSKLHLGFWGGAGGTYNLSGTGSLQAGLESVGNAGWGVFNHTGGTNTAGNITVGLFGGAWGSYSLEGTAVLTSNQIVVGDAGVGYFYHQDVANPIAGNLVLGNWGSGNGRYELSSGGSLSTAHLFVGGGGRGTFVQTGGSIYAGGNLVLANLGGASGTMQISGTSTLSANIHYIGGAAWGRLEQSGGNVTARGNLVLGNFGSGNGTFVLSGGDYSAQTEHIGGFGVGVVQHSGGTHTAAGNVQLGTWGSAYGRYELSGTGYFEAPSLTLGGFGQGHVVQTGGEALIHGTILLEKFAGAIATYTLGDGILSAAHVQNNFGSKFYFNGGDFDAATFANGAQLRLGGAGVRVVTPVVTNTGSVFATETEVSFVEPFTNHGAFHSDNSDNEFVDLDVKNTGYVTGTEGSRFFVSGDLTSASTKSLSWDTAWAELTFIDSADDTHTFTQTGADLGPTLDGYTENFAWGKLALETAQSLTLNGTGGAVYVDVLELADGIPQIASITSNGANIYYNQLLPENAWLDGDIYAMNGSGVVQPVPEPSMLLMLGAGVSALFALGRARGVA